MSECTNLRHHTMDISDCLECKIVKLKTERTELLIKIKELELQVKCDQVMYDRGKNDAIRDIVEIIDRRRNAVYFADSVIDEINARFSTKFCLQIKNKVL